MTADRIKLRGGEPFTPEQESRIREIVRKELGADDGIPVLSDGQLAMAIFSGQRGLPILAEQEARQDV